ncbi:MAG: 3-deoxy-manno-octulosonate cytidylyltransferase [Deltaproteobacteria bacterium]|nr:3-deoxy-manno-octulosonate cytidylyltransferase [Deltaproteobacteria bacterium]
MNIVAFIPARYDSTRFQGKPLALIAGRPMIQHVYTCAKSCADVSEVYVATDDKRILDCVHGFGGKALLTGEGHPSGTDRVAEAAQKIGLQPDDVAINVQGDQPLFRPVLISQTISPLLQDGGITMSTLMHPISDDRDVNDPNCVKVVTDAQGYALFFSRSPIPFFRDSKIPGTRFKHLGFYGYRMGFLSTFAGLPVGTLESAEKLEQLRALENGFRIKVVETRFDSVEVDTPADVRRVEEMLGIRGRPEP